MSNPRRSRDEPTSTSPSHVVSTTVETCRPASALVDRAQVRAVDDLVPDQAGRRRGEPHELALARLERERRAGDAASGALHGPAAMTTARAASSPGGADAVTRDARRPTAPAAAGRAATSTASTAHPSRSSAPAATASRTRARAIARGSHWRSPGNWLAPCSGAGQLRLERAHLVGAEQPRAGDCPCAPAAPARPPRCPRPGARSARPCAGSGPRRRAAPRARRRAPGRRARSPAPGPASLSEQSTLPSPSPVVPPDTAPRSSSVTATPRTASSRATAAPTMPAPTTATSVTARSRPGTGPRRRAGTAPSP